MPPKTNTTAKPKKALSPAPSGNPGRAPAPKPGSAPGFTLVEILVSVLIITLGLCSAIYLQTMSIKQGTRADNLTVASLLAEYEIERLKTFTNYNEIPEAIAASEERLTREGEACGSDSSMCFIRTTTLASKTPTNRSHTVTVTVTWSNATGPEKVVYEAILTDINLGNSGSI